jgi:hypothetical protein
MLENKSTRGTKKPAAAAKKAAPKVAVKSAPIGGNGEVLANQGENAAILIDPIRDLVNLLAENIGHNTELLKQIDRRRADQTGDRPPVVEQLRTILNYKAIGQMTGRRGDAFQRNLISARRVTDIAGVDGLLLFGLPVDATKVSVQVDGAKNPEVLPLNGNTVILNATAGRDIGRIEVLNSEDEPLRLAPRMVVPTTNNRSSE